MLQYMLDTDTCSYLMKGKSAALVKKLQTVAVSAVCVSAITKSELLFGIVVSPRPQSDRAAFNFLMSHLQALDYPAGAAEEYGQIRAGLKAAGKLIGPNDLLIAAHARYLGLILVTNNTREFARVPQLKIENWT
jgi:tRNA(fMet)-specific endonuclease VapC